MAAADAKMINAAKKIPGFIEVSVHCALGGYMKKPRRSGAFRCTHSRTIPPAFC
jgi:hypothetical protein